MTKKKTCTVTFSTSIMAKITDTTLCKNVLVIKTLLCTHLISLGIHSRDDTLGRSEAVSKDHAMVQQVVWRRGKDLQ